MDYQVIVIGGGHAGCEAATAAARLGARTLLVTSFLSRVGQMSCNPAVGGVAKGTLAREVDAMGGLMGRATDRTTLHFRMLNRSKGPAVRAPRAQCDRGLYPRAIRLLLEQQSRLELYQGTVTGLILEGERIAGVRCQDGRIFGGRQVILTAGTFLRGRIRMGVDRAIEGGRAGDPPAVELAEQLAELGLRGARFKTGTPPRVDGRTVDFRQLERQDGDDRPGHFSHWGVPRELPQRPCWITYAGEGVKEIVSSNLARSAMYGGAIGSAGPRYCPSIEDKIVKFPDAARHQVFLEPEGLETHEVYVNGLSTSLPPSVQAEMLARVPGLAGARMTQPGYAIEYDYFEPQGLDGSLELEMLRGLRLAGQVNGTTGYEEAAGQGLVAGINAGLDALERDRWMPRRDEAYLGVLVDDLITRGVDEPYRLFTSRAEFRLLLRQDNCLLRLGPTAVELGLLTDSERRVVETHVEEVERTRTWVGSRRVRPEEVNAYLEAVGSSELSEPQPLGRLLKRPEVSLMGLAGEEGPIDGAPRSADAMTIVEMELKYAGYIERDRVRAAALRSREEVRLDPGIAYEELTSLSSEAREKLERVRPATLGQAGRIPGVSAADLQNLLMEMRRRDLSREATASTGP
ncbi:MAG: tRNA uridine-5-carboxymethylaminomethyl(34) synthesis enzyme MnmG [Gemmatimonadota bacterium]